MWLVLDEHGWGLVSICSRRELWNLASDRTEFAGFAYGSFLGRWGWPLSGRMTQGKLLRSCAKCPFCVKEGWS